jgi:hypothetical protein
MVLGLPVMKPLTRTQQPKTRTRGSQVRTSVNALALYEAF